MRRLLPGALLVLAACPRGAERAAPPAPQRVDVRATDAAPVAAAPAEPKKTLPRRLELAGVDRTSFGLAADATHVYWVDYHGGGGVFRAKKDVPGREQLAGEQPFARDIAVDDAFVYWARASGPPGGIFRVRKEGGDVETFADAQWSPERVMVVGGRVLWNASPPGVVLAAPRSGGAPVVVAQARTPLLTARGTDLFYVDEHGTLSTVAARGGAPAVIRTLGRVPADIAADETHVYVAELGDPVMPPSRPCPKNVPCPVATTAPSYPRGEVLRVAIAGGASTRLVSDLDSVSRVAVDDAYVYFASRAGLARIPKGGGAVESMTTGALSSRVLVDGDRLLFQEGDKIVSLAR